ncbi:MAG: NifB/NifX family molybdenum-iron cluster-binding protein [Acidimicrobiales bacterium]
MRPAEPPAQPGPPEGDGEVVVAVAVTEGGLVDPRWGRASTVALATVRKGVVSGWEEHQVDWGMLRATGSERAHHARVARFMKQHGVGAVVAGHMGPDMLAMLERMGLSVHLGAHGDARQAVLQAATSLPSVVPVAGSPKRAQSSQSSADSANGARLEQGPFRGTPGSGEG